MALTLPHDLNEEEVECDILKKELNETREKKHKRVLIVEYVTVITPQTI